MNDLSPKIRIHLWMENENGLTIFGPGRASLIENIEKYGSLKKAIHNMGISYRAAWGKIKQTEEILGKKLIEKTNARRNGFHLTEFGKRFTESYRAWCKKMEYHALEESEEVLLLLCGQHKT